MQSGVLTVIGKDSTSILLTGLPREVFVRFKDIDHVPCDPHHHHHHHDHLKYEIDEVFESHKSKHHNRKYYLVISWEVHGVREIDWCVLY